MKRFIGKVAIITGSGKGIGKAIAIDFAREGAKVILVSRTEKDLINVSEEIKRAGSKSLVVKADVSKEDDVKKIFKKTIKEYKTLDILVNNAAIQVRNHILYIPTDEWKKHIDINLTGVFFCMREALKIMVKNNYGKIVNISSNMGKKGFSTTSSYSASKFGILGLTEASAADLVDKNININAICPAGVETPLAHKSYPDIDFSKVKLMKPEEISKVVLFLASDDAKAIKGSFIDVCGGQKLLNGDECNEINKIFKLLGNNYFQIV